VNDAKIVWVEQGTPPFVRYVCVLGTHRAVVHYLEGDHGHYPGYRIEIDGERRDGARTPEGAKAKAVNIILSEDETRWRPTMTKHTPGPWAVDGRADHHLLVGAPGRRLRQVVAEVPLVVGGLADPTPEAEANARLIAAAPDLLAACRDVLEFLDNGTPLHPGSLLHQEVEAAVARAEGTP
jgi:hypothetical protein